MDSDDIKDDVVGEGDEREEDLGLETEESEEDEEDTETDAPDGSDGSE